MPSVTELQVYVEAVAGGYLVSVTRADGAGKERVAVAATPRQAGKRAGDLIETLLSEPAP